MRFLGFWRSQMRHRGSEGSQGVSGDFQDDLAANLRCVTWHPKDFQRFSEAFHKDSEYFQWISEALQGSFWVYRKRSHKRYRGH